MSDEPIEVKPRRAVPKGKKGAARRRKNRGEGKLVIVESPAKARTVGKFLGKEYMVRASIGHVRDLLKSQLSVDVNNDFAPKYRVPKEKKEVVKELTAAAKEAAEVYLATDPDREGEAIAWHLMAAANIDEEQARRVVFHEITKGAIDEAFSHPQKINMQLVNAQQARRILDRLVGYKISPLLWERVRSRTSAGRVQSVALRLIVEREREIAAFIPVEYWSIEAELAKKEIEGDGRGRQKKRQSFIARLQKIRGEDVDLKNESDTQKIVDELEVATYIVAGVRKGERSRNPSPPYTTSTMQQEASRRLGFTAKRTMAIAQGLYEGVELGEEGMVGLITYMRTDSVNVAEVAQAEARAYISERYGPELLPPKPPVYKTRTKSAQEAHEAIRPTSVRREPEQIKKYLSRDQYRLYDLIWKRFVASQMKAAVYDTVSVDIEAGPPVGERPYLFRAPGSRVKFPGFLIVYEEARDEDVPPAEEEGAILPDMEKGEWLDLLRLLPEQHFTQPPPRYSEATLVKTLEEYGIGRPSTYAPIISTIQARGYVERVDKRLVPTEIGFTVNDLVVEHFSEIVDYGFTAQMEENLDRIAGGEKEWVPVLREFYGPFAKAVAKAEVNMPQMDIAEQPTGEKCEKCGHPMVVKFGRYGKFIACSNFPECRNTKPYTEKIGVACPKCGGDLVQRKTRKNRIFYGCANYPKCEFAVWNLPLPQPCPHCGGLLVQTGKQMAKCTRCEEQVEMDRLPEVEAV
jgi:DNA topoisomerase-1